VDFYVIPWGDLERYPKLSGKDAKEVAEQALQDRSGGYALIPTGWAKRYEARVQVDRSTTVTER
jgi:hypothetical protein